MSKIIIKVNGTTVYEGDSGDVSVEQEGNVFVGGNVVGVGSGRKIEVVVEGDIDGNLNTSGDVRCGGVCKQVASSGDVTVTGNVGGGVKASGDVEIGGYVIGDVEAADVKCGDITGSVEASGDIRCTGRK